MKRLVLIEKCSIFRVVCIIIKICGLTSREVELWFY